MNLQDKLNEAQIELQRINMGSFFHKGCMIHTTNNIRNGLSGFIQLVKYREQLGFSDEECYDFLERAIQNLYNGKKEILKKYYKTHYRCRY